MGIDTQGISPMPEMLSFKIARLTGILRSRNVFPKAIMMSPTDYEGILGEYGWKIDDVTVPNITEVAGLPIVQGAVTAFIVPVTLKTAGGTEF